MNKEILNKLGLGYYNIDDFYVKPIVLRDGRDSRLWIHKPTGHGILDSEFWVRGDFYSEQYRDEFSADSEGERKKSEDHFRIYKELNDRQFNLFKNKLTSQTKYLEIGCIQKNTLMSYTKFQETTTYYFVLMKFNLASIEWESCMGI